MFGKNKKPLSEKAKYEKRQHRKQVLKTCLHVFSYICTGLFWLVCLIGLCSGSCSKSGSKLVIAHASSSSDSYQSQIFYPSDINTNPGKVKFYLGFQFRNYNLIKQHLINATMIDNWSSNITNWKPDAIQSGMTFTSCTLKLTDGVTVDSLGNYGFHLPGASNVFIDGLTIRDEIDGSSYFVYLTQGANVVVYLYGTNGNTVWFDANSIVNLAGNSLYMYEIIDYVFGFNLYFTSSWSNPAVPTSVTHTNYEFFRLCAYYWSNYSFDFNGYQFGGSSKYLATSYLFNRVYNGAFIYMPSTNFRVGTDTAINYVTQKCLAFSGLWEYQNTLYSKIYISLMPAFNNYYNPTTQLAFNYNVEFFIGTLEDPQHISYDILNAANSSMWDYYFITSIEMFTVDNTKSITLAYNLLDYNYYQVTDGWHLDVNVHFNQDIRLYQTDSFINNNGVFFTLYRIDYDRNFSELGSNPIPCLSYRYYSDFFFGAFVYTGLYSTVPPSTSGGSSGTNIFNPVFTIFKNGLSGLLPFLNLEMLPGISFGVILMMPFAVTIILFVVRLFKR